MKNYLSIFRVEQWVKNLIIFFPIFFGLKIANNSAVINTAIAFLAFSFMASAIYILNDVFDIEEDRLHPQKKFRSIASGKVGLRSALLVATIAFVLSIILAVKVGFPVLLLILGYFLLNLLYSTILKHVSIIDVSIIAAGFVMRLFVGSFAANVPLSMWIILISFILALFLAIAKRRDDLLLFLSSGVKTRKALDGYSREFLDASIISTASILVVSYILYTVSPEVEAKVHNQNLYITSLFVILGILRYLQIIFVENRSGSPTKIFLTDRFIQTDIILWLITFTLILY